MRAPFARHWPVYLMEACELALFVILMGVWTTLLEYPGSPVRHAIPDPGLRRALRAGLATLTGIAIVYSPLGSRSGAHLNPAVTLTFLRIGRVAGWDAIFYVSAQFVGACLGVTVMALAIGSPFIRPPVAALASRPGPHGVAIAFVAELVMAFLLMLAMLACLSSRRAAPFTGVFAGLIGAVYIYFATPLSGVCLNPASGFASAWREGLFDVVWVYFVAPPLGMLLAAEGYLRWARRRPICVKMFHPLDCPCPFLGCGYSGKPS